MNTIDSKIDSKAQSPLGHVESVKRSANTNDSINEQIDYYASERNLEKMEKEQMEIERLA